MKILILINTTGATSRTGTAYPCGAPALTPRFLVGFVLLDLQFYVYVLQIVACPFVRFLMAIVLSVPLRFTDSDYPFGIFKLFLCEKYIRFVCYLFFARTFSQLCISRKTFLDDWRICIVVYESFIKQGEMIFIYLCPSSSSSLGLK